MENSREFSKVTILATTYDSSNNQSSSFSHIYVINPHVAGSMDVEDSQITNTPVNNDNKSGIVGKILEYYNELKTLIDDLDYYLFIIATNLGINFVVFLITIIKNLIQNKKMEKQKDVLDSYPIIRKE